MASQTSNYGFNLPEVDGSEDLWGELLNQNWTQLDALLEIGLDGRLTTVEGLAGGAVQAQELADPTQGGELVHVTTLTGEQTLAEALNTRVIYVATIADLQALPTSELVGGQVAVVGADGDNNGVYTYVATAWGRISTDPVAIADLEGRAGDLEGRAGVLEDRVGDLEGGAGVLEGRVGDLEGGAGVLEGRVDDLENNIDATLQPYVDSASVQADRAEAAADAAFVNADVYDDVAAGIAGTDEGEQFQVVEGAEVVRYRNESGSAVEVARYPSVEFVEGVVEGAAATSNTAIDLASQPGLVSGEFYTDDSEQPLYSITDEAGNAIASWDQEGYQEIQTRGEFHTGVDQPAYAITDANGVRLLSVDENAQVQQPFIAEFHTEDGQPSYAWTDKDGVVFYGIDEDGRNMVGGGSGGKFLTDSPFDVTDGESYRDGEYIKIRGDHDPIYGLQPDAVYNNADELYAYFDELLSKNPDYIEKIELGRDALDNPIYQYTFSAIGLRERNWESVDYAPPKVVIVNQIHGSERTGGFPLILLAKELCNQWRQSRQLKEWRWGVTFVMVPCLNPSGLNENPPSRTNHNSVDLNRNFPADWQLVGSPGSSNYSGPSAGSELETQIAMTLPDLHPDALLFIDMHNHSSLSSRGYATWTSANSRYCLEIAKKAMRLMTVWLKANLAYIPTDQEPLNRISNSAEGRMVRYWANVKGKNAILFESVTGLGGNRFDVIKYNVTSMRTLIQCHLDQHSIALIQSSNKTAEI